MCNFWSAILTRDSRVLWDKNITSHEELISKFNLNDSKLDDRDFVRIEITPQNIASKKKSDWSYNLDEPKTVPFWYANNPLDQEKLVWNEWRKMVKELHESFRLAKINLERQGAIIERVKNMKPGDAIVSRSAVESSLAEYVKRLKAQDTLKREWGIAAVKFYTPTEWDSVRDSVWYSVRDSVWYSVRDSVWDSVWYSVRASVWASLWASVWASVRDSVWDSVLDSVRASVLDSVRASVCDSVRYDDSDNYGLPLLDVMDAGCVFYGIDKQGVAHVIMVGKEG